MNRRLPPIQWPAGFSFVKRAIAPKGKPRTTGRRREPVVDTSKPVICFGCRRSNGTLEKRGGRYFHKGHMGGGTDE